MRPSPIIAIFKHRDALSRRRAVALMAAVWIAVACLLPAAGAPGKGADPLRVAVLVSLKIRPYLDAVDAMEEYFADDSGVRLEVNFLEPEAGGGGDPLLERLKDQNIRLAVAIGPEAMRFLWTNFPGTDVKKMYAMVLDPEKVVPETPTPCGIALNIPASLQIREFRAALPALRRLGLIYNPQDNQPFADAASAAAAADGLQLVHLRVESRGEIPSVLNRHWRSIQALWMIPDRVAVSESLVPYVIKEAMANDVAVIGYNRFFMDSGAAMALVRNYRAIGARAGAMARAMLSSQTCNADFPAYDVLSNDRVLEEVGLKKDAAGKSGPGGGVPP